VTGVSGREGVVGNWAIALFNAIKHYGTKRTQIPWIGVGGGDLWEKGGHEPPLGTHPVVHKFSLILGEVPASAEEDIKSSNYKKQGERKNE